MTSGYSTSLRGPKSAPQKSLTGKGTRSRAFICCIEHNTWRGKQLSFKCCFPLAEARKKRKTFFSNTSGSLVLVCGGVGVTWLGEAWYGWQLCVRSTLLTQEASAVNMVTEDSTPAASVARQSERPRSLNLLAGLKGTTNLGVNAHMTTSASTKWPATCTPIPRTALVN